MASAHFVASGGKVLNWGVRNGGRCGRVGANHAGLIREEMADARLVLGNCICLVRISVVVVRGEIRKEIAALSRGCRSSRSQHLVE